MFYKINHFCALYKANQLRQLLTQTNIFKHNGEETSAKVIILVANIRFFIKYT